ncbi:MAG: hypothetical protein Q7T07_18900 [Burkholderiaceae bacterium]|nr:hypothetical protein [Burkholderiaceae bacterium]
MEKTSSTPSTRAVLSFTLQGLPFKEELLFKSIVRLLDHRTHQSWLHYSEAEGRKADLVVVTEDGEPLADFSGCDAAQRVLTLGSAGVGRDGFLCRPLHSDAVEAELNRLGMQIVSSRQNNQGPAQAPAMIAEAPLRLLRWPSASLVGTRERMRLATLLTSQPMTLTTLQQRSGLDASVCALFVADLEKARYLSTHAPLVASPEETVVRPSGEAKDSAPAARTIRPGLISRIRTRLGIQLFGTQ